MYEYSENDDAGPPAEGEEEIVSTAALERFEETAASDEELAYQAALEEELEQEDDGEEESYNEDSAPGSARASDESDSECSDWAADAMAHRSGLTQTSSSASPGLLRAPKRRVRQQRRMRRQRRRPGRAPLGPIDQQRRPGRHAGRKVCYSPRILVH